MLAVSSLYGLAGCGTFACAQQSAADVELLHVRRNFYLIAGAGGNIGAMVGPDGVILVDAGSLAAADQSLAALRKASDQPIRYIINTGPDADHVGGNGKLSKAGRNIFAMGVEPVGGDMAKSMTDGFAASILAAENVLRRISAPAGKTPPLPEDTFPSEAFTEKRRALFFNGEGIDVLRQPAAHTDGDSIVFFRASDIIMAGDIIDATRFPVIDVDRGGSVQGEIDALNRIVEMAIRPMPLPFQEGGTFIIPGHGHIYAQDDVVEYRDMIVTVRDVIQDMIRRGMTLDQILAASPAKGYEPVFGATSGPWTTKMFIEAVYKSLTAKPAAKGQGK